MTKSELIKRLAKKHPNLRRVDLETLVECFLNEVSDTLSEGGRVELRGFGAFSIRQRDARTARNPKNGQEVKIGARNSIYFRAGKELRERINAA